MFGSCYYVKNGIPIIADTPPDHAPERLESSEIHEHSTESAEFQLQFGIGCKSLALSVNPQYAEK